ncbi:MAG: hypothetical protein ACOC93_00710 [Planctomycetota bacterium]
MTPRGGHIAATLAIAVLLGLAAGAQAISYDDSYTGPVEYDLEQWMVARQYTGPRRTVDGADAVNRVRQTTPEGLWSEIPGGRYRGQREDAFSVLRLTRVVADDGSGRVIWTDEESDSELVGLLYGLVDTGLAADAEGVRTMQAAGGYFEIWEQPSGSFNPETGPGGRTAFGGFEGIGRQGGVADSSLVLRGRTAPGVSRIPGTSGEAHSRIDVDPASSSSPTGDGWFEDGSHSIYLDSQGGGWKQHPAFGQESPQVYWDAVDPRFGATRQGDLGLQMNIQPYTPLNSRDLWVIASEDPAAPVVMPEPITLVTILLGAGGVGGYARRRLR